MGVVVIGTVAWDSIETPFGKADPVLGGSAYHFAAAASFFAPVFLAAVVGEDFHLEDLDFLKKRGVDLSGVKVCPGRTFRWSGRYGYDPNHRETVKTELGVIADYSPDFPPSLPRPEYLFLGNIHPGLQEKVLAGVGGKRIFLDTMNLWISTDRPQLEKVLGQVHGVVINEEEARELTREVSLARALRKMHAIGPQTVVVKRGEYGAILSHKGEFFLAPGLPLEEVRDPTGAGDVFAGGMIGFLSHEGRFDYETLKKAVIVGSALASFNVEEFGSGRLVSLSRDEIRGRVEEFRRLGDFGEIRI